MKATDPFLVVNEEKFSILDLVDENEVYNKDVNTGYALGRAKDAGLDLVCFVVGNKEHNSLCKLVDFGKWKYENDKRRKKNKSSKASKHEIKEIRFSPNIGEHDIKHKLKHAREFIEQGHELIFSMRLRRRISRDFAQSRMNAIIEECKDFASVTTNKSEYSLITVRLEKNKKKKE